MDKDEGLTEFDVEQRIKSGNYILEAGKIVSSGFLFCQNIVSASGLDYILDIWFIAWRASRYGMPGGRLSDHAFSSSSHQFFDEDDEIFLKKIQKNKQFFNSWRNTCLKKGINPSDFEWLFVGTPRTPAEMFGRIGAENKVKRTILWGLLSFKEVCGA